MSKINLRKAIDHGIRKVSWWWLPLCILSCALLFTQKWLPKSAMSHFEEWNKLEPYRKEITNLENIFNSNSSNIQEIIQAIINCKKKMVALSTPEMINNLSDFIFKIALLSTCLAIVGCFLYVVMIIVAKSSVTGKEKSKLKGDLKHTLPAAFSYIVLGLIKGLSLLIFIPGIYFYVRLMFTGIIITEKSRNPFKAIKESWLLTKGEVDKMFALFLFELLLNIFAVITVIGVIPVPPMRYTIRTAVYRQLQGFNDE